MVLVEPVPQRLQLMDVFMNTARSQCALFNVLSTASPNSLCGMGGRHLAPRSFVLPEPLKHQMPHRLSVLLSGTSPTNTTLAWAPVRLILYTFWNKSQGGVNSLYWSHQFDIEESDSAPFFPTFGGGKVLMRLSFIVNSCRTEQQMQLPGMWCQDLLMSPHLCFPGSGEPRTQGTQPRMSVLKPATSSVTLVIQKPEGKNSWLDRFSICGRETLVVMKSQILGPLHKKIRGEGKA